MFLTKITYPAIFLNCKTYVESSGDKGIELANNGQHTNGIACLNKALEYEPQNNSLIFEKGKILNKIGKFDESITCYDDILNRQPNNEEILYEKAKTLLSLGKIVDAVHLLQRIVGTNSLYREIIKRDSHFTRLAANEQFIDLIK